MSELKQFWADELEKAKLSLKARDQSRKSWASGTSEQWRAAGCEKTKAERLNLSNREGRIAIKARKRIEMIKETIRLISES